MTYIDLENPPEDLIIDFDNPSEETFRALFMIEIESLHKMVEQREFEIDRLEKKIQSMTITIVELDRKLASSAQRKKLRNND